MVYSFFHADTNTVSHIAVDESTKQCAVIDSVLDYNAASARITYDSADQIIAFVKEKELSVQWVIETHAHADHLSAAPYVQQKLGGTVAIGESIKIVQEVFGKVFNFGPEFERDARQFDHLFADQETFKLGSIDAQVIHTPGHTPADMTYIIGDAAFVGDTLFMPDFGTARCDFPGGSAENLYASIQKIYTLPDETRLFLCHDYLPEGRTEYFWETTVGAEKAENIHVATKKNKSDFIKMRTERDATLSLPKLMIPSIQTNIRAGHFGDPEENGTTYLKVPLNKF